LWPNYYIGVRDVDGHSVHFTDSEAFSAQILTVVRRQKKMSLPPFLPKKTALSVKNKCCPVLLKTNLKPSILLFVKDGKRLRCETL
jgi:hypothetical protein